MDKVKLPNPPLVCPSIKPNSGLSDMRPPPPYKGPRKNNAILDSQISLEDIKTKSKGLSDIGAILPTNFDWRDKKDYVKIEDARDQGLCGSCWAFSSSTCLGDRYAIKFGVDGKIRGKNLAESKVIGINPPRPSVAWTLSCGSPNAGISNGCDGGLTSDAFELFGRVGSKLEACWPYNIVENNPAGKYLSYPCLNAIDDKCCNSCCGNPIANHKLYTIKLSNGEYYNALWLKKNQNYFITSIDDIDIPGTILNIKKEIYTKGPVVSAFAVYGDFNEFWNNKAQNPDEVYIPNASTGFDGGHAVVIVGWGVNSKGIEYWSIRNSWGNNFSGPDGYGDNGYFKMACSNQIPDRKNWNGIDVPIFMGNSILGGALTFDIPDTMEFVPEKYDVNNKSSGGIFKNGIDISNNKKLVDFVNKVRPTAIKIVNFFNNRNVQITLITLFVLYIIYKVYKKIKNK